MADKEKQRLDDLVQGIGKIASSFQGLSHQAYAAYAGEVHEVLSSRSKDTNRIERLLDGMLGFCFDSEMLKLFKELCRCYYFIDPGATASYVLTYREMWEDDDGVDMESVKRMGIAPPHPPDTIQEHHGQNR